MIAALCAGLLVLAVGSRIAPTIRVRGAMATTSRGHRGAVVLVAIALMGLTLGPILAALGSASALLSRRWSVHRTRRRTLDEIERAYPDAIEILVLAIRAGDLPAAAVSTVAPYLPPVIAPAFAAVRVGVDRGERFADSLSALTTHIGQQAQPLVDSLAAADRYGLPLAPVLDRLAFEARQQRRRAADARARQLPVRLSVPLVLCTLPSFVLLAIVPLLLGAVSSLSL